MADAKDILLALFTANKIAVPQNNAMLAEFLNQEQNIQALKAIIENQDQLMSRWKLESRVREIIQQPLRILNATTGRPYEARIDFDKLKWKDIAGFQFEGLEDLGLRFDENTSQITGVPLQSGDFNVIF